MQNSIYKIKYLLFLSWDWEAWCLTQSGEVIPPPERNTAWNRGRKFFHCLGAPNNLIRPWDQWSMHRIKEKCRFKDCKVHVLLCYVTILSPFTCYIIWHVTVIALSPCFYVQMRWLLSVSYQLCAHKSNAMLKQTANSLLLDFDLRHPDVL